ncbi:hypothetical protein SRHO_G00178100 [Serrasalmus rhombeus]
MKILLFFTLQLISGQVGCVYVIGYPGGDVLIYCEDNNYGFNEKYFCKLKQNQCEDRIVTQAQNRWNHTERFSLYDAHGENFGGLLVVTFKQPSLQDAGSYQCGETGAWNHTVKLTLNSGEKDPTKKPESTVETTTEESKCKFQSVFSGPVIITVCVCVTVLLIGGSALIYKLVHNKTPGSVSRGSHAGTNRTADRHYENASFEDQNIPYKDLLDFDWHNSGPHVDTPQIAKQFWPKSGSHCFNGFGPVASWNYGPKLAQTSYTKVKPNPCQNKAKTHPHVILHPKIQP